jgi:glycosyltransferase involved in cell wall biosynthesis
LFVGRLHPVKGLPLLIQAWSQVRPPGWRMRVVGPDEGGHRSELEAMVRVAGLEEVWYFDGPLDGPAKWAAFRAAELFILPSHTENFGIAVAEALACEVPVITTRGAPWEGLLEQRCGWWTEVGVDAIAGALSEACATESAVLREMGQRGRAWVERDFAWAGIAGQMRATYEGILTSATGVARR